MSKSPSDNYCIIIDDKNSSFTNIVKINFLTPDKFYFSKDSIIEIPKILTFELPLKRIKKSCHFHKNFDNEIYLYFSNFDLEGLKYVIPFFECNKFKCMNCNVIHNKGSLSCCHLINSPIEILEGTLTKIYLPKYERINETLSYNREKFLKLHFSDLVDKI